jgi:hypothetical protein
MKKLFIAALAVVTFGANAQDVNFKSKRGEYMLPEKGDWALGFSTDGVFEYLGNAFNGNTGNNAPTVGTSKIVDNGFKGKFVGKYFTKDKAAYRIVFNLATTSITDTKETNTADNTVVITPAPTTPPNFVTNTITNTSDKLSGSEFSIGIGKEWRRGKTRLQGFYGADVLLFFSSLSRTEVSNTEILTTINNPAPAPSQTIKNIDIIDKSTKYGGGFGFGLEGFIGAEYFLFPKIAIGAQYTYSARYFSTSAGNITTVTTSSDNDSLANPAFTSTVTTNVVKTNPKVNDSGLSGVNVVSMNLTLHF